MANSKQIVYLSQAQYAELIANGTITVNGVTVTYDENDIYVTPQAEPVTDVRVNGASVAANGVANIPIMSNTLGVAKVNPAFGVYADNNGSLQTVGQNANLVKSGTDNFRPVVSSTQDSATFYGLAKAAGHDEKNSTEPLGTYTPEAKGAIQKMLGVSDLIATEENNLTASKAYAIGDIFTANGKLYKATAAIAQDAAIILPDGVGANCEEVTVSDGFPHDVQVNGTSIVQNGVAGIPVASAQETLGLVKVHIDYGLGVYPSGLLSVQGAGDLSIKAGSNNMRPISCANQHKAIFYGLSKAAGVDLASETVTLGTYPETSKTAIQNMLDVPNKAAVTTIETKVDSFVDNAVIVSSTQPTAEDNKIWVNEDASYVEVPTMAEFNALAEDAVTDVQIDGSSIVQNGVATIPTADATQYGTVKVSSNLGVIIGASNCLSIQAASTSHVKAGTTNLYPIAPNTAHATAFYGLAKAAGDTTQSTSNNAVGDYTESAKSAISTMLNGSVSVSGTTPTINALPGVRYICGEVSTITITVPASGIIDVVFTSGSTPTVLTVTPPTGMTIKWANGFDPTALDADTTYEINIADGLGVAGAWT